MGIEERLLIGDVLIKEFKRLASDVVYLRNHEDLSKVIKKANAIKVQMYLCYRKWDKPPVLLHQIQEMDIIIKKIEELHNKHV